MGNNCKSVDEPSKFREPHFGRIIYKAADNNQHNIAGLLQKVVGTKAKHFSTDSGDTKKGPPSLMPMTEFIKICSRNRPAGISDISWDRFVSSVCLECFWIDVQGEVDKRAQIEAETSSSGSPYRLGKKYLMEEVSGTSTPTASDLSVEFAGKYIFPDADTDKSNIDYDESDVVSHSLSSLSDLSFPKDRADRLFAKYDGDLTNDEKVTSGYDKQFDLKYAVSLGDIKCNSVEGKKWYTENKISSKGSSTTTTTEPG